MKTHLCGIALTGPMCGKLEETLKNITLESNEATISFMSGPHRSGRGFLLSYSSDQYPGSVNQTVSKISASIAHIGFLFSPTFMKSVWSLSPFSDAQTAVCLPRSHQGPFPAQSGSNKGLTHIDSDERSSPNLALRACLTQNLFVCGLENGPRLLCKADTLVSVLLKWDATCH